MDSRLPPSKKFHERNFTEDVFCIVFYITGIIGINSIFGTFVAFLMTLFMIYCEYVNDPL